MGTNWKAAYTALYKVYAEDAYSNLAINEALRDSDVSSQSFVRVMTKGVIRDTILIDANINRFADNGIKSFVQHLEYYVNEPTTLIQQG